MAEVFYCAGGTDGYVVVRFFDSAAALNIAYEFYEEEYGCTESEGSFTGYCSEAESVVDVVCSIADCIYLDTELSKRGELLRLVSQNWDTIPEEQRAEVDTLRHAISEGSDAYNAWKEAKYQDE